MFFSAPKSSVASGSRAGVTITLRRADIERLAPALAEAFQPEGSGDWGGAAYPEIELTDEQIAAIGAILARAPQ